MQVMCPVLLANVCSVSAVLRKPEQFSNLLPAGGDVSGDSDTQVSAVESTVKKMQSGG